MNLWQNPYRIFLFLQGGVIVGVMASFRLIPERSTAALVAGALFLVVSSYVVLREVQTQRWRSSLAFWATLIFLLGFAIPIFGMRVAFWGQPFSEIEFLGIHPAQLHNASNFAFLAMLATYFVESFRWHRARLK